MPEPVEPDLASIEQGVLALTAFFAELRQQPPADAPNVNGAAGGATRQGVEGARTPAAAGAGWLPGLMELVGTQLTAEQYGALLERAAESLSELPVDPAAQGLAADPAIQAQGSGVNCATGSPAVAEPASCAPAPVGATLQMAEGS
ncbi:MAG: hypothetical protein EHM42_07840 [Planctomycetaceae bacterium]|nr:MAG: hypothetical protein EHM42_11465 [Planctomycetaceae bacterium]RPI84059.1 MAG: hypothetical protein EHM42_07840 [Planctomycetaceae bacterium]